MKWLKKALVNWKPLLGGIVAAAPAFINQISPILPPKYQATITAAGVLWMALFTKQKNVTGGDVKQ